MALGAREKKIVFASKVSIGGNALLSVLKIVVGIIAGSLAVVADGIDSASDIITSLITLYTAHVVARPPDKKYPYGYLKADTIATKVLAFIIFFAGAQLAFSSVGKLIDNEVAVIPDKIAVYIIIVSIIGKLLLSVYLRKVGKEVESAMLIANARNMQNDVVISFSVLAGLIFTFILKMPIIDVITALLVSIYIMFIAFRIFMQTNRDLMDGVDDEEIYRKIVDQANRVDGASNPHRIRVRKMAHLYLIALDIEVDGKMSLEEAHELSAEVEQNIKQNIQNVYDVLVHVEPFGNCEIDEVFGVSEEHL
ncbi:MAG: cation diffusion facilitator family transporter [Bacteroidetes bacterium]|nr:cation diffusion facilitator family transporter [Bacteroidota bacterium]